VPGRLLEREHLVKLGMFTLKEYSVVNIKFNSTCGIILMKFESVNVKIVRDSHIHCKKKYFHDL